MSPSVPKSKLPGTGTTIFTVMSQLAAQHGAVNLSQGFPDFDPLTEITITAGATEALFCAILALAGPGDEVVVFDPAATTLDAAAARLRSLERLGA